jgi:enoyl-CoA hydratase/carnithine racemase
MSVATASESNDLVLLGLDEPGGFATVTLNNPGKRNALSHVMMKALIVALHEAGDSSARGIILAANGPVFSAGHDFADMAGQDLGYLRKLLQTCNPSWRKSMP